MLYAYNGDAFDQDTVYRVRIGQGQFRNDSVYGYGNNPPAQAIQLLSDTLRAAVHYRNDFSTTGNPTAAAHFYNYLQGRITTGVSLMYGGDGLTGTNGQPWPWMYDGDPVAGTGWTESSVSHIPSDRRGLFRLARTRCSWVAHKCSKWRTSTRRGRAVARRRSLAA